METRVKIQRRRRLSPKTANGAAHIHPKAACAMTVPNLIKKALGGAVNYSSNTCGSTTTDSARKVNSPTRRKGISSSH